MKRVLVALILSVSLSVASAQTVINDANAESRNVTSFHAIQVSSSFEVLLTQGNTEGLAVSANEKDYLQHIKTVVENGVLKIWYEEKGKWWPRNLKLKAYISAKNLDEIKASGASDVKIQGQLSVSTLHLNFTGASDLKGKIEVSDHLKIDLSGASDITVTGSANETSIKLSGASDVKGYDFATGLGVPRGYDGK